MRPTALLLLCALVVPASAQINVDDDKVPQAAPKATGPKAPPPKRLPGRDQQTALYEGDVALLTLVKGGKANKLLVDQGKGTPEDPRHHYLIYKTALEADQKDMKPLLVFRDPAEKDFPAYPKSEVYISAKPAQVWPSEKPSPVGMAQLWKYLDKSGGKGLYTVVSAFDPTGRKPSRGYQVLWWGLSRGQDLEALPEKEREKVLNEIK
jgi:hypothetical protein